MILCKIIYYNNYNYINCYNIEKNNNSELEDQIALGLYRLENDIKVNVAGIKVNISSTENQYETILKIELSDIINNIRGVKMKNRTFGIILLLIFSLLLYVGCGKKSQNNVDKTKEALEKIEVAYDSISIPLTTTTDLKLLDKYGITVENSSYDLNKILDFSHISFSLMQTHFTKVYRASVMSCKNK